ncbi:hypothetical protein HMPREF9184_00146 [Streptococcus sp. oral taxon 058 str. F0407]|nr:hypothetical protein HMPREF9184_00146 [Streptococcus sp. oral taxon 058 str. F0407]
MSASPYRTQVQPAASFLVCSLIFIEYKKEGVTLFFCVRQSSLWYNISRKIILKHTMEVVMDNIIDVSIPVAEVVDKHPEVLEILVELGFKPLANPLMRNTVGRKVSLKQGSKLEGTPMDKIVRTLEANGYEVIGLD